jgi:hypothetical protein
MKGGVIMPKLIGLILVFVVMLWGVAWSAGEKYTIRLEAKIVGDIVVDQEAELSLEILDFFNKTVKRDFTVKWHILDASGKELPDSEFRVEEKQGKFKLINIKKSPAQIRVYADVTIKNVNQLLVAQNGIVPPITVQNVEAGSEILIYNIANVLVRTVIVTKSGDQTLELENDFKKALPSGVYKIVIRKNGKIVRKPEKIAVVK